LRLKDARKKKNTKIGDAKEISLSAILFLKTKSFCNKKVKKRIMKRLLIMMHCINTMATPPPLRRIAI